MRQQKYILFNLFICNTNTYTNPYIWVAEHVWLCTYLFFTTFLCYPNDWQNTTSPTWQWRHTYWHICMYDINIRHRMLRTITQSKFKARKNIQYFRWHVWTCKLSLVCVVLRVHLEAIINFYNIIYVYMYVSASDIFHTSCRVFHNFHATLFAVIFFLSVRKYFLYFAVNTPCWGLLRSSAHLRSRILPHF